MQAAETTSRLRTALEMRASLLPRSCALLPLLGRRHCAANSAQFAPAANEAKPHKVTSTELHARRAALLNLLGTQDDKDEAISDLKPSAVHMCLATGAVYAADEAKPRKATRAELRARRAALLEPLGSQDDKDDAVPDGAADDVSPRSGQCTENGDADETDKPAEPGKVQSKAHMLCACMLGHRHV